MKAITLVDALAGNLICHLTRALTVAGFLLGVSSSHAQMPPPSPYHTLDLWEFNDTNWLTYSNSPPVSFTHLLNPSDWDGHALLLDSTNPAWLAYLIIDGDVTNFTFGGYGGTIEFWFAPDWNSGVGPGDWGRLIDIGAYSTNSPSSWWSLYFNPQGTNLYFSSETDGVFTNYLYAPIAWTANTWHLIDLTYSHFESELYLDGQLVTNGAAAAFETTNNTFYIGSDNTGTQQARGKFDDMATYNYPLNAEVIADDYTNGYDLMNGITPPQSEDDTNSGGITDYTSTDYGDNLWIRPDGILTNTFIGIVSNTEPGIQYEIESIGDLTQTNWHSEGFIYGSETTNWTTLALDMTGRTNAALFFRVRSWIDSYDIGIPDWWQLEFFGVVGIDPYGNPAGDGYSNLYKYQHDMNPLVAYAPQPVTFTITPTSSSSAIITWNPAQGAVESYTIYQNDSAIATVSASQLSYELDSPTLNLNDGDDGDFQTYTVAANYSGASYSDPGQTALNPRWTIAPAIFRGAQGRYYLAVPNIPNGVTAIRLYVQPSAVSYPDSFFNLETYQQPADDFTPVLSTNIIDVPAADFTTNGLYAIPTNALPYYGDYSSEEMDCRAVGPNGMAGPSSKVYQTGDAFLAESEIRASMPFVDGTEQLKENLAFQLEAADESNAFSFYVYGANAVIAFPQNYAYAGFYFPFDYGISQYNYAFLDPFKPFEDNYFYRNFIYAPTNLNSDGSLASGVYYDDGVQVPNETLFSFPEYDFVTTGNTNDLQPQLSATADQWIYTAYTPGTPDDGNIGVNEVGTNLYLDNGQANLFGLSYQSAKQLYSDGTSLYAVTLNSGGNIPDQPNYPEYFYGQVAPPQLQTVGYYFAIPNQDYLPGHVGFTPTNGTPSLMITAVGQQSLVTAWAQEELVNGISGEYGYLEQYFDKAYLAGDDGNIDTNNPTGLLSEYGEFLATQAGKTILTTKPDSNGQQGQLPVYAIDLTTDVNHDGAIDTSFGSPDFTSYAHPFRFWVNDNNDSGDTGGNDIPGYASTFSQTPNGMDDHVNGVRDLIDFFPVYIDIRCVLQAMQTNSQYAGLQFRLSQADGALNFVETSVSPGQPLAYLTDTNVAQSLANATVTPITASGVYLDSTFLNSIRDDGLGVILVEARTNTSSPLVLDVLQGGNVVAESQVYLSITGVEQMFRHKNLTADVTGNLEGPPDRLADFDVTNEPDTDNNNFIFVHGYNVNPNQARGWESAIFKRMFWSGSHAKFYGVTWDGYDSQGNLIPGVTADYQTNVVHAFQTAPYLANFINGLSGTNTLAAHSLGNMVALSAISDWGASVKSYFMLDAAVPIEAIDGDAGVNTNMVPPAWLPYDERLWASFWHQVWPSGDTRNALTWNDRLANFNGVNVYNFYSSGEEVLRTYADGAPPANLFSLFGAQLVQYIENQSGTYVWAWQEKDKGLMSGNTILSSDHGGWGLNEDLDSGYVQFVNGLRTNVPPTVITNSVLQTNAFFDMSYDAALFTTNASGGDYAQTNRDRILSDAIPAVTLPLGANYDTNLDLEFNGVRNFDMQLDYENGWPPERGAAAYPVGTTAAGEWHHSDIHVVAYTFTHKVFDAIVTDGNLK